MSEEDGYGEEGRRDRTGGAVPRTGNGSGAACTARAATPANRNEHVTLIGGSPCFMVDDQPTAWYERWIRAQALKQRR